MTTLAALHDAYAADYDAQVAAADAYIAEALFGLCYALVEPGQRLLDLGIGSGLPAGLFQRAGLRVDGMDFSEAMLDLCRAKGIGDDLRRHDLLDLPWPYESGAYDHLTCCGVFHFLPDLRPIFAEAARVLRPGGLFAFTTKTPAGPPVAGADFEQARSGDFDLFSHTAAYLTSTVEGQGFVPARRLPCCVGQDRFEIRIARHAG